jgi:hypothetical protein
VVCAGAFAAEEAGPALPGGCALVGTSRQGGVRARDAGAAAAVIGPRQLAGARAAHVAVFDVARKVLVGHQPSRGREGKAAVGHLVVGVAHGVPVALDAFRDPLVPHLLQAAEELVAHSLVRRNNAIAVERAAAPTAAAVLCPAALRRAGARRVVAPGAPTAALNVLDKVTQGLLARALVGASGFLEWLQAFGHVGVVRAVGELECAGAVLVDARHALGVQLLELAGGEGGGAGDEAVARQAVDESAALCGVVRRSRVVDAHRVDARTVRCP